MRGNVQSLRHDWGVQSERHIQGTQTLGGIQPTEFQPIVIELYPSFEWRTINCK